MLIAINQHHKTSTIPSHHTRQRITQQRINPKRRHIAPIDRNAIISHSLRRENSTRSNVGRISFSRVQGKVWQDHSDRIYPIALAPRDYAINSCSEQTCQQQKPTKFICDRDFLISPVFIKYLETALLVPNRLWL
jgi:hypothetical protein